MSFDIAIDGSTDSYLDSGKDLALVDGGDRLEQHVYLNVGAEVEALLSGQLTGQSLSEAEDAVRRGLNSAEDVDEILSVEIDRYDQASSTIYVTAFGTSGETELEIDI